MGDNSDCHALVRRGDIAAGPRGGKRRKAEKAFKAILRRRAGTVKSRPPSPLPKRKEKGTKLVSALSSAKISSGPVMPGAGLFSRLRGVVSRLLQNDEVIAGSRADQKQNPLFER